MRIVLYFEDMNRGKKCLKDITSGVEILESNERCVKTTEAEYILINVREDVYRQRWDIAIVGVEVDKRYYESIVLPGCAKTGARSRVMWY